MTATRARFEAVTQDSAPELAELAASIWREYWPAFLGTAQTEYMVEQFQSLPAIERDMREYRARKGELARAYSEALPKMTSVAFWKSYLGIA